MSKNSSCTPAAIHGLRLVFPPLSALLVLVLTEWIARSSLTADTFLQYIFPHAEAYLLAWGLLFLVWLTIDWLTRFAPLATLLIMGGIVVVFIVLSVILSCRGKRGDRQ